MMTTKQLEKNFWDNMEKKHIESFNNWYPKKNKKIFFTKEVFKNILDFCGDTEKECYKTGIYGGGYAFKLPYICCKLCSCRTTHTSREINYINELDKFDEYNRVKTCVPCWLELKREKKDFCADCNKIFTKKYHFCDKCYSCYNKNKGCMIDSDSDSE